MALILDKERLRQKADRLHNKKHYFIVNGNEVEMTIDEAVKLDKPEGTVWARMSATLVKRLYGKTNSLKEMLWLFVQISLKACFNSSHKWWIHFRSSGLVDVVPY